MADLTPIEKLAVLLFTTYQFKSGEIYRGTEWTFTMNPDLHAMAAWKWSRLGQDAKDVWLALATQAKEFVAPEKRESAQGQLCAVGRETEGTRRQNVALAGHGLRDHRAGSAAYCRTGSRGGLTDGE